ncbi:hypothetical protein HAX54_012197, partial [Datura stramonium]|nr:hypothetical protein [Datura stramonium]
MPRWLTCGHASCYSYACAREGRKSSYVVLCVHATLGARCYRPRALVEGPHPCQCRRRKLMCLRDTSVSWRQSTTMGSITQRQF